MKINFIFSTLISASALLFLPSVSMSEIVSGNLASVGQRTPSGIVLDLVYNAMNVAFLKAAAYYQQNDHCAAPNAFLKRPGQGNFIDYITNDKRCAIIVHFGQSAPGPLKGQYIAMLPKKQGSTVDFSFQQNVTSVDSAGNTQSIFSQKQPPWAYSTTFLGSNFGKTPSASIKEVLNTAYEAAVAYTLAANSSTSGDSGGGDDSTPLGPQGNAKIQTV